MAAYDQGANVTYLDPASSHIGSKESIKDTARVLGRFYDGLEYRGTSYLQCFTTCQPEHGVADDMARHQAKLAVESGYWHLYRYNPMLEEEGKNPFILDSKAPDGTLQEFLGGEVRFAALEKSFPEESKRLRAKIEAEVNARYAALKKLLE